MRSIMVKTPHDSSFSLSKRFFHWKGKVDEEGEVLTYSSSSHAIKEDGIEEFKCPKPTAVGSEPELGRGKKKKPTAMTVSKLRSAFSIFNSKSRSVQSRSPLSSHLGTRVIGTLFGYRRGYVHFTFQEDPKLNPGFLIELAMPTSILVHEMASGLVRIALECETKVVRNGAKLLEEPLWKAYCNGKKCGYAMRRECGSKEWRVLKALAPISMGAGVLPGISDGNGDRFDGEVMYMRAKFERVVGSKDSEAFYMMNPDDFWRILEVRGARGGRGFNYNRGGGAVRYHGSYNDRGGYGYNGRGRGQRGYANYSN